MKLQATSGTLSLIRYNPPPFSPPHRCTTPFSLPKHRLFMAACIDTSRAETAQTNQLSCEPNGSQLDDHMYKFANLCRPSFSDLVSCVPMSQNGRKRIHTSTVEDDLCGADLWLKIQDEARSDVEQEPILSSYYYSLILSHKSLESALANHLSIKLSNSSLPSSTLYDLFMGVLVEDGEIMGAVKDDLRAVKERDPACISYVQCLVNFKGFLACQAHRVAHRLWSQGRKILALVIQNRVSEAFAVDIHPGAKIGRGILLDHATGVVIGETAVIGDDVSILHNVTLGGTGKVSGDRHPKLGDGVLIGAGTCILGNVRIGDGAKVGAGSVVLKEVPPKTTAVGNPARLVGGKENPIKLDKIPSFTMDQTSHIFEWSDYVI
ncbi:serine acetyltransferase 1, chloroplastic [Vitis riparia]|uniref:serine acetyltransferase 1, chloroplastic n=1 Tax=Vitis riparia TaxID=96939 RepID=UPI00155A6ABC|nr:serine acetyltransferase 1, chloroplastic [Vitis riparia]